MKTIYKYEIPIVDRFSLELPENARILCVQTQRNIPQMWVLCDEFPLSTKRKEFVVFGTGHKIPDILTLLYIGTFQIDKGSLVFHLFEIKNL